MQKYILFFCICVFSGITEVNCRKNWVLIVSGAKGYNNYFSQADSCHAYHTVINASVPAENVIHLSYDDVPTDPKNPFQNNLVNIPGGPNLYPGCKIDYRGGEVTPEVFLKVMLGDKEGVRELIGREGRVLESGPDDHVFISLVDHGGPLIFGFPDTILYADDLVNGLKKLHEEKRYSKLVFYLEACYSGSMFDGLLPDDIDIYAATCANPNESGYMCCFDEERQAYVGTQWGNGWMYDSDSADMETRTIIEQFNVAKKACQVNPNMTSHPQQYGDLSINEETIGQYQSDEFYKPKYYKDNTLKFIGQNRNVKSINLENPPIDMVEIATLTRRLNREDITDQEKSKLELELSLAWDMKLAAEEATKNIVKKVVRFASDELINEIATDHQVLHETQCYKDATQAFIKACPAMNIRKYHFVARNFRALANLCNLNPRLVPLIVPSVLKLFPVCQGRN